MSDSQKNISCLQGDGVNTRKRQRKNRKAPEGSTSRPVMNLKSSVQEETIKLLKRTLVEIDQFLLLKENVYYTRSHTKMVMFIIALGRATKMLRPYVESTKTCYECVQFTPQTRRYYHTTVTNTRARARTHTHTVTQAHTFPPFQSNFLKFLRRIQSSVDQSPQPDGALRDTPLAALGESGKGQAR